MTIEHTLLYILLGCGGLLCLYLLLRSSMQHHLHHSQQQILQHINSQQQQNLQQNLEYHKTITDTLRDSLQSNSEHISKSITSSFEKTTATFSDITKRLALIDAAQQNITDLSKNVVGLQEILSDKRTRGAFGEVQLHNLLQNILPSKSYALQYQLSNGLRCDCMLFLPEPNGNIAIDSKFPLESYQIFTNWELSTVERTKAQQQFRQDVRKHILAIADKYIIANETGDGAIMFIPAESVFAEIHSTFPELVTLAQDKHVWLASPATMMAILTTVSAVLKDDATKQHLHTIQEHLQYLAQDFTRFQERMDKLAKHIALANEDVQLVNKSAKKITARFKKIEQVDLGDNISEEIENSNLETELITEK